MKKIIAFVLTIVLLSAVSLCTAEESVSDWTYEVLEDGSAMIIAYSGEDSEVIIPGELDGHTVTSAAFDVFRFTRRSKRLRFRKA